MINDTINPMTFDFTKNLHGHVRVELRDRWTGRVVDSQEKDNLVTNAVQDLIISQAWKASVAAAGAWFTEVLPLYSKALGGLLLFNGTLTESATNIGFPASAKLVGCAGQTSDNVNPIKGSLNPQESVYTSTGYTTVWDFATSQANGTIASLARTSDNFINSALTSVGASFLREIDTSTTPSSVAFIGYDKTNKYLYFGTTSDITVGAVSYPRSNIYRVKADFYNISLLGASLPPASKWTLVKTLTSSDGSAYATDFIYDKYANNFVYATGTTIHIVAMDGTHTTKTATGTSGGICVTENYYWRLNWDTAYCIQKSNLANTATFTGFTAYQGLLSPQDGDTVAYCGGAGNNPAEMIILYPDGATLHIPNAASSIGTYRTICSVGQFLAAGTSLRTPSTYLGTIANLDSPVTKTSSQTMKISYTLTEA